MLKHFISFRPQVSNFLKMNFSDPRMAGQWLLPEVWAALLLEFQTDVGQQEDRVETGTLLSRPVNALLHRSLSPVESGTDIFLVNNSGSAFCEWTCSPVSHSTTVGSVGRRCAANVHPNVPPSPWWALNSRCVCVTAATSPSLTKSE